MICCYNAARNDPYKESHHPRYTPLVKVPDAEIRTSGMKRFGGPETTGLWLDPSRDASAEVLAKKESPPVARHSVWEGRTLAGDADAVVGKLRVHSRKIVLWHMARCTFLRGHWTRFSWAILRGPFFSTGSVAAQATFVVGPGFFYQRLVWVVAGHAGQSCVSEFPALARFQPIRLKAQIADVEHPDQINIRDSPVTRSAKFYRASLIQAGWIENEMLPNLEVPILHGCDVFCPRSVAGFTGHAFDGMCDIKVTVGRRRCRVASKAVTDVRLA
jgi:hypothetical protein